MPQVNQKTRTKIEINTPVYGYIIAHFTFDAILGLLRDNIIREDDYIEFVTEEGLRAAVRKKDITSIEEVE